MKFIEGEKVISMDEHAKEVYERVGILIREMGKTTKIYPSCKDHCVVSFLLASGPVTYYCKEHLLILASKEQLFKAELEISIEEVTYEKRV